MSFEEQVRERAYHIWLAGGQAEGRAIEHWVCAEQALRGETSADAEPVVILTKAAAKPRKAAAAKPAAKPAAKAKAPKSAAAKATAKPVVKAKAARAPMKTVAAQPTAH